MDASDIKYWSETQKMCEEAIKPHINRWNALKERLGLDFTVAGVTHPIYISRFYKIVREVIASIAFRNPYLFVKAEDDPADPDSGEILQNASPILEDFANDALEKMRAKIHVQKAIFDALFCFRGWLKFGFLDAGSVAPYLANDAMEPDFTYVECVPPHLILADPLCPPHDLHASRYVGQVMFPSMKDVLRDQRFKAIHEKIASLKGQMADEPLGIRDDIDKDETIDSETRETLKKAHSLAQTRKMVEWHDRVNQRRIVFLDGIEEPIEDIPHPFLYEEIVERPDPATGKPLLSKAGEKAGKRKKWLVEGGLPFFSLVFDTTDEFYGDPIMAYENPIQNTIIRSVSRRVDIMDRFKRLAKALKAEMDANPQLRGAIRKAEDGEVLELVTDINGLQPLEWGGVPPELERIEQSMLTYEGQTIRTSAIKPTEQTATESAIGATESELNRNYNQQPVQDAYIWMMKNVFSIMSDDRYAPTNLSLRMSSQEGAQKQDLALKAWHLRGKYNINVEVGSANILYEALSKEKTLSLVQMLRGSPNVDEKELDRYVIRAHGEMAADKIMKPDLNTDAAKAAELENQMFFANQHDPGVTEGEDHDTHLKLQAPDVIQAHPRWAQTPPELQEMVLQIATKHAQAHKQMQEQEAGRIAKGGAEPVEAGPEGATPEKALMSQVQSAAQETQNLVSKQAEEVIRR